MKIPACTFAACPPKNEARLNQKLSARKLQMAFYQDIHSTSVLSLVTVPVRCILSSLEVE